MRVSKKSQKTLQNKKMSRIYFKILSDNQCKRATYTFYHSSNYNHVGYKTCYFFRKKTNIYVNLVLYRAIPCEITHSKN